MTITKSPNLNNEACPDLILLRRLLSVETLLYSWKILCQRLCRLPHPDITGDYRLNLSHYILAHHLLIFHLTLAIAYRGDANLQFRTASLSCMLHYSNEPNGRSS